MSVNSFRFADLLGHLQDVCSEPLLSPYKPAAPRLAAFVPIRKRRSKDWSVDGKGR